MGLGHENIVNQALAFMAGSTKKNDVLVIGEDLSNVGADSLTDGGFWIWDINSNVEFYSDKFRETLGFEGEQDFPSVSESWQAYIEKDYIEKVFDDYTKALESGSSEAFKIKVVYNTKQGDKVKILCSSTIVRVDGDPAYLIGTHILI